MLLFVARRMVVAIGILWVIVTAVFLALHLVPGDAAEMLLTQGGIAPDPAAVAALRRELGLDQPLMVQYRDYLGNLLQGHLGNSLQNGRPVWPEIAARLPRSLELVGWSALAGLAVALPAGVWAAIQQDRAADRLLSLGASLALSIPVFVLGMLGLVVFTRWLGWIPANNYAPWSAGIGAHLAGLALPAAAIAVGFGATVFRAVRSAVIEAMGLDLVTAAITRGLPMPRVFTRHVLRNASFPIVTIVALNLGTLIGGTVLIEAIFNYPGIAAYLVQVTALRDYPQVMSIVVLLSAIVVAINFALDILYMLLDPRVAVK